MNRTLSGWRAFDVHGRCIAADVDSYRAAETALLRLLPLYYADTASTATFDDLLSPADRILVPRLHDDSLPCPRDEAKHDVQPANPDRFRDRMNSYVDHGRTLSTSTSRMPGTRSETTTGPE